MRPETRLQRDIRMYLRVRGYRSVHVPNGSVLAGDATKRAIQMNALKRDGLMPGFPDLLVYAPDGRVGHIEVKCEGGKVSETQKDVRRWMDEWGHKYAVCRSLEDVAETLEGWGWQ
jgi:VRR-NUC domain